MYLIEDSAQSLGSYKDNKHLGTWGDIGIFSFSPPKIISTGNGGVVITNNDELELKIRKKGELKNRTLYYYSCDISDNGFFADTLSYNYLSNMIPKGCNAMVKSASYL